MNREVGFAQGPDDVLSSGAQRDFSLPVFTKEKFRNEIWCPSIVDSSWSPPERAGYDTVHLVSSIRVHQDEQQRATTAPQPQHPAGFRQWLWANHCAAT